MSTPTPDDLAGTPACVDDAKGAAPPRRMRPTKSRAADRIVPSPTPRIAPSADDLAGTPVCMEEDEESGRRGRRKTAQ
jgi:hypothetical protein